MKCPYCGYHRSRVLDTRDSGDGIRRRRLCLKCQKRFTTYEQVSVAVHVVKSDGLRLEAQAFLEAIRTRQPPITHGESGLRVLRVLQAAQRSLITNGEPVRLPMEGLEIW